MGQRPRPHQVQVRGRRPRPGTHLDRVSTGAKAVDRHVLEATDGAVTRVRPRGKDDSGAYAIIYGLLILVMVGTAALVLDIAAVRHDRRVDRAATDAGACTHEYNGFAMCSMRVVSSVARSSRS